MGLILTGFIFVGNSFYVLVTSRAPELRIKLKIHTLKYEPILMLVQHYMYHFGVPHF